MYFRQSLRSWLRESVLQPPFDMMIRNRVDRYHLVIEAFALAHKAGVIDAAKAERLIDSTQEKLAKHREYIY